MILIFPNIHYPSSLDNKIVSSSPKDGKKHELGWSNVGLPNIYNDYINIKLSSQKNYEVLKQERMKLEAVKIRGLLPKETIDKCLII